jgi:toxin ParE1/3/4
MSRPCEINFSKVDSKSTKGSPHIARHPATGSPRSLKLSRYPYLVFFIECEDYIDVWRVLCAQRDIPAWLADDVDPDNLH